MESESNVSRKESESRCICSALVPLEIKLSTRKTIVDSNSWMGTLEVRRYNKIQGGTMRRTNILLVIALALASLASVAWNQVNTASAQEVQPVGIVVAYVPGQSITIVNEKGIQSEFTIDPSVQILPPEAANSLKVGSLVTIIAPASINKGKQIAVGIVVKTDVPEGSKILAPSGTPQVKDTAATTGTPAAVNEKALEMSATPQVKDTAAPTSTLATTEPPKVLEHTTPTTNTKGDGTASKSNGLIEWLRTLLRQLLGGS